MSNYTDKPSGVRLVGLIQSKICDVVRQEAVNDHSMSLYCTGEYWIGFERSAYFLKGIFPNLDSFIVNHPDYPFAIVGISVSAEVLYRYLSSKAISCSSRSRLDLPMPEINLRDYEKWHRRQVEEMKI